MGTRNSIILNLAQGRSMLSMEVGLIGLVAWVGRHTALLGRERMDNACFKSRFGESPLGKQMVVSRSFHYDDGILDIVLPPSGTNVRHSLLEE